MFVFASSLQGGSDHDVGLLCLLLAAVAALLFWFVDRRSLPRIRSQHAAQVRSAYEALHCRDQQVVETTDSGLVMSCGCGQVIRPWEYLISFREHPKFLFLQTKNEPLLISKSAFQNEAELTEFRADILGHLNSGRPWNERSVRVTCTYSDYVRARLLHFFQGRGWKRVFDRLFPVASTVYCIVYVLRRLNPTIDWGGVAVSSAIPLIIIVVYVAGKKRRRRFPASFTLSFNQDGMRFEGIGGQTRLPWKSFSRYLQDRHNYLLCYRNPRAGLEILPKRAFNDTESAEFERLLAENLGENVSGAVKSSVRSLEQSGTY
ncbi:MAG: hypothetical protein DMG89_17890 [Acidobacteria bacterium]|nr:MAG: hypothetical protein DMG89_17890 [Acidobacteriota bacterium]